MATAARALVGRAGRTGDPALAAQADAPVRRRAAALRPHRDLRRRRLDDVARPALVLDHLRAALHRRPGAVGAGLRDRRAGDAVAGSAPLDRRRQPVALPRPRQAALRLHHAVGLPVVLAVPDHLVGEPAEEIPFYLGARAERLAVGRLGAGRRSTSCCPSCCCCRATSSATGARLQRDRRLGRRASGWSTTTGSSRPSSTPTGCRVSLPRPRAADRARRRRS